MTERASGDYETNHGADPLTTELTCPQCQSKAFKRNGYTRHGKQNHRCLDCGRQFSCDTENDDAETQRIINELSVHCIKVVDH